MFYKPLIAIVTFYAMHYVSYVIMHLLLIFYNIDFLKSWFTGTYTDEQIAITNSPTISGISYGLCHIMVLAYLCISDIANKKTIASTSNIKWKYIIPTIVASFLLMIACEAYQTIILGSLHEEAETYANNFFTFASLCITGPIVEEALFRESIQGNLERNGMKTWLAILISATIFSALHFSMTDIITNFFFGILAGMIYTKTKSIIASSMLHITNNTLAFLIYADYAHYVSNLTETVFGLITYISAITLLFIVSAFTIWYLWKKI